MPKGYFLYNIFTENGKEPKNYGYLHTGGLDGVKHFALWPLVKAAQSCFGTDQWPGNFAELKSQGSNYWLRCEMSPGVRSSLDCWDWKVCWWA